jgi:hypothetical protein
MVTFARDVFSPDDRGAEPGEIEGQFLSLWYFGVLAYCLLVLTEGSARYLLPLVPPFLIVFMRHLESREVVEYRQRSRPLLDSAMLASGSLVMSLGWGLLLSHADLEFARIYPRAAHEFSRISSGMSSYFEGEWGFRYYFSREGAAQLPADDSLVVGGSWLARPKLALPYRTPTALASMTMPVQTLTYDPPTPLRLLDWRTPAGFWSTGWGLIPFSLSRQPLEEVDIRQVNFMVEGLPWANVLGSTRVAPWPGYLEIQEKSPLALLVRPGTSISYPWTAQEDLNLELRCGIGPDAYREGQDRVFRIAVRQHGSEGRILAEFTAALNPGLLKEDRKWQPVMLELASRRMGGEFLEFACDCGDREAAGTVAFAEAILRHR